MQNEINTVLQNNGYVAQKIEISISNDETYNINQINIKIKEKVESKNNEGKQAQSIVETIKQIVIDTNENKENSDGVVNENDKSNIKKIINSNFGVDEQNIIIN